MKNVIADYADRKFFGQRLKRSVIVPVMKDVIYLKKQTGQTVASLIEIILVLGLEKYKEKKGDS